MNRRVRRGTKSITVPPYVTVVQDPTLDQIRVLVSESEACACHNHVSYPISEKNTVSKLDSNRTMTSFDWRTCFVSV